MALLYVRHTGTVMRLRLLLVLPLVAVFALAGAQVKEPHFVDRKISFVDMEEWYEFELGFDKSSGYYMLNYGR